MSEPTAGSIRSGAEDPPWSADLDDVAEQRAPLNSDEIDDEALPPIADDAPEADVLEQRTEVPGYDADDYR